MGLPALATILITPSLVHFAAAFVTNVRATARSFGSPQLDAPASDSTQASPPSPELEEYFAPQFYAPQLTPTQFLMVSSPSKGKVVYTELNNFKSVTGRTFALIDSGLTEPAGLAFDNSRSLLYVADRGASTIFRYRVLLRDSGSSSSLATDGVRLCVMQGHPVEWVSVDPAGNLFFADTAANTINRISADTLDKIGEAAYQCGDLRSISQKEQMAKSEASAASSMMLSAAERAAVMPSDAPDTLPVIVAVYEGSENPHVTVPAGVSSDGNRLWWGNRVEGRSAGSIVQGEAVPRPPLLSPGNSSGAETFPAIPLTSVAETTYGVAHSNTMVFFSTNKTGSGSVYGVMRDGSASQFVSSLIMPRGLVWDGDNTVYVADQALNKVYSFPAGRLMDDVPLTQSVVYDGAFGVALFTKGAALNENKMHSAGWRGIASWTLLAILGSLVSVSGGSD